MRCAVANCAVAHEADWCGRASADDASNSKQTTAMLQRSPRSFLGVFNFLPVIAYVPMRAEPEVAV